MFQKHRTDLTSRLSLYCCAFAVGVAVKAVVLAPVSAGDRTPTAEEKEACIEDVFRLCSSHIPDRAAITACLRSRQGSLSQQCRYVISGREIGKNNSGSK
ncbi:hypothetical protein AOQ72_16285 [Bradyrhizobium yuanmingense]|uniref:Cysteine rich repeat-containing protein n=1 Tax=Bradyrhizobium yuanmingense TaxID=108015 RepID=A0A0R3CMC6_9BRAD|nr:hypothetical protein AOQ72_16285 [Bradyrhizobium yuanmingense]